ncbi:MAG: response regulator receiver protein [Polaromonas sp.]|nr:response regulator receiver protein [Polaromonas sp.]
MTITAILVDDDKQLAESLIPMMEELAGVQVIAVAETPAEAVGLIARYEQKWQLLILDVVLRNGSGMHVLQACQNRLPHQRIVVLTNMATAGVRRRCLDLGVDAVFDKLTELNAFFDHCKASEALARPI